jgi:hypothetical protein
MKEIIQLLTLVESLKELAQRHVRFGCIQFIQLQVLQIIFDSAEIFAIGNAQMKGNLGHVVLLVLDLLEQCRSRLSVHPYCRRTHLKISLSH